MKILSLGWGVQSFTLAAMAALGEIEPVDAAVHADTGHESALTYDFARRLTPWLEERGVKVVTVYPTSEVDVVNKKYNVVQIPIYTAGEKGNGQTHRQCTGHWKIEPIRRWTSDELGRRGLTKKPGIVTQLIGISWDEIQRMKPNQVKYIENQWPLIEKRMTRQGCVKWLEEHGLELPSRSACTFCPFKSSADWRLTQTIEGDWKEAVQVDKEIRERAAPAFYYYLHPSRKPLEEVDFRTAEEKGQLSLWDNECSGICGV
jgi:hypothetical protein